MTKTLTVVDQNFARVQRILDRGRDEIAAALPRGITSPERMIRVALTSLRKTPKLLECDPFSIMGCLLQAAQLGLETDGISGQAHLVPFGQECQLIIGYRGLILLAHRTGRVNNVFARIVHEGDRFEWEYGLGEDRLVHQPSEEPGEWTHVYGVVRMKDGDPHFVVMTRAQVEAVKAKAPGARKRGGPWDTHPEEMAKKTVIRRVLKTFPFTAELSSAITLDEMADAGVSQDLRRLADGPGIQIEQGESILDVLASSHQEPAQDAEGSGDGDMRGGRGESNPEPPDAPTEEPPSTQELRERAVELGVEWEDFLVDLADRGLKLSKKADRGVAVEVLEELAAKLMAEAASE